MNNVNVEFKATVNDCGLPKAIAPMIDLMRRAIIKSSLDTHGDISESMQEMIRESEKMTIAIILFVSEEASAKFWVDWKNSNDFSKLTTPEILRRTNELMAPNQYLGSVEVNGYGTTLNFDYDEVEVAEGLH